MPVLRSIGEGARFVWGHQILLGALALDMFAVLLGGAVALLPAFIKDILHLGPEALGILRAAPALGSICVASWLARKPLERNAGRILRSEERRVGKEWFSTCRSRWSPDN